MKLACPLLLLIVGCATAGFDESRLLDLTYPFNDTTVYWPTANRFELTQVAYGLDESGKWYASNDYGASEHGGTHLDAPIHFAPGTDATDQIPLSRLIGPGRVVDISDKCAADRDYVLTAKDIEEFEARHGPIKPGDVVLVRTGWGRYYPDLKPYLGSDVPGVAEDLHFPGISPAAADVLVKRKVDMVGIDTASIDHGPSVDFDTHRVLYQANIPGLENVANLDRLPTSGATIIALPMKIENGTGGPCRIIAILP